MITYVVDEQTKIIKCIIKGKEVSNCVNKILSNIARDYKQSAVMFKDISISNEYIGIATYHTTEANEFDIEVGKEIARNKAFRKINNAIAIKLNQIKKNVNAIQDKLYFECQKFELIRDNINDKLSHY